MVEDMLKRIEQRLQAVGLTARAASLRAGLPEDAIRNLKRAKRAGSDAGGSVRTLTALAPVLQTTANWLATGFGDEEGRLADMVPVIGHVGADSDGVVLYATGQGTGYFVPIPPGGSPKSRALLVKGFSMPGFADDGALLYFEEQHLPPTADMVGYVVLVETEDGDVLVKRLLRGSEPGLYDLESIAGPTLTDRRLAWAANITAIIPPKQARKIIISMAA